MLTYLEFEKPVAELQARIDELKASASSGAIDIEADITRLEAKVEAQLRSLYARLTPWQKTLVARHPSRPHFKDIAASLLSDFTPLAGDRKFGEDYAIIGGPARFRGQPVIAIGHEKGADTASRLKHNFGMAKPEGYRKAVRLMEMADRFGLPVITFVDTSGAFPGIQAEERGQAEAVARATEACLQLAVPMVASIVGEGGSGGALALAAANRILMLEHAVYAVISPEGCASILWRTADKAAEAAEAMKQTAQDLKRLQLIDGIVAEPLGGAHRNPAAAIAALGDAIEAQLRLLAGLDAKALRADRRAKFLAMGRSL
jgi:acetyl-CoA carboxylase carboxyl transferase subunit alpha